MSPLPMAIVAPKMLSYPSKPHDSVGTDPASENGNGVTREGGTTGEFMMKTYDQGDKSNGNDDRNRRTWNNDGR
jgi:hypothetical protein